MLIEALRALQHRGQEAWGMAIPAKEPFRWLGLVTDKIAEGIKVAHTQPSSVAIGHTRYSTVGKTIISNAQPVQIGDSFSVAHNGTISNTEELAALASSEYEVPSWASDTMIAGYRLHQLQKRCNGDWFKAFELLSDELNGAYSFVFLDKNGDVYAARDEMGFRPLCIGWHEDTASYIIASESCALSVVGARLLRCIEPGEILMIGKDGLKSHLFKKAERHAHCAFEYTYFAHPSSWIEGINVYSARKGVGKQLAKLYQVEGDVVIPVPDSARPAALGFSESSGIPLEEGLMKDRYGKKSGLRSFIEPRVEDRREINRWIIPVETVVKNKDVILIDDSIVRGTSSTLIARTLKNAGAKSIKLLVTFPPILYPCYAGIDFPTQEELLAHRTCGECKELESINRKVREAIGVDFVGYNSIEGLAKGIGLAEQELCLSCATGDYSCLKFMPSYTERMKKV